MVRIPIFLASVRWVLIALSMLMGTKGLAVATLTASTAVEENHLRHRTCPAPEPEPPSTPRSKARKLAEDYAEGLVDKAGLEDETLRAIYGTAVGADSMGQYAYDQMEQEIAVKAALKQNRGETLSPYEVGVLHDYRMKEGMPLAIAVGFGVGSRVVGAAMGPAKKAYQAAKRAMGKGSVERTFQSKFWNRHENHTFLGQTNKVYKRDDLIDLRRVDPDSGLTNFQLMQKGRAPLGPDNAPVNLHHMTQTQSGPIAEVTRSMHSKHHRVLHMWTNQSRGGVTRAEVLPEIDRALFERWKVEYWKERASQLGGLK